MRNGEGTYSDSVGHVFKGTWKDDMLFGKGSYRGPEGSYEGDWNESLKQGKGTFLWTNGDKYVGDWSNDNMNGTGQFSWSNGKNYEGHFCDGQRHGVGILNFPGGAKYEGQWKADKCHGKGRYTEDAGVYEGDWADNQKHGHGIFKYKNGQVYDGQWEHDKKTKGYVWTPDGDVFRVAFDSAGNVTTQDSANLSDLPSYAPPKEAAGGYVPSKVTPKPRIEEEEVYTKIRKIEMKQVVEDNNPWDDVPKGGWDYSRRIPYVDLKLPSPHNRPDIDVTNRELYLDDGEFEKLMQMDKATWKQLPQWRKNMKKKQLQLF
eukprot:NODE_2724_length_1134_cov_83.926267_g2501_i0.p1 GENE.NODE_2724_length_1134_cov_83.926267_g2501_i0~~NODE_2724_length_1134_cov_83.926267_g2501_i0.p1  ORF type:complete len:344 (-),score=71.99 NODE_2724_length_1134_cov_83.926267_g2501_i0:102-1052(-)